MATLCFLRIRIREVEKARIRVAYRASIHFEETEKTIWYKTKKKGTCAWTDTNRLNDLELDFRFCDSHVSTGDTTFASMDHIVAK